MTRDEQAARRAEARARRRPRPQEEPGRADGGEPEREAPARQRPAEPRQGASTERLPEIASRAREHLRALHGADAESVSGFARTPQGWRVTLEVVELRRIPDSTDVLASYEVELDDDGGLLRFARGSRYTRSQVEGAAR